MNSQDLDFDQLTDQEKNLVIEFTTIVNNDDVNIAIGYLKENQFSINNAIQNYYSNLFDFNKEAPLNQQIQTQIKPNQIQAKKFPTIGGNERKLIEEYKKFLLKKENMEFIDIDDQLMNISSRPVTDTEAFEQFLSNKLQLKTNERKIKFNKGTLKENIKIATTQSMPLLVFLFKNDSNLLKIQALLINDNYLSQIINERFHVIGLLKNSQEAKTLKQIPQEKIPCIGCFKNNLFESIQLIELIAITKEQTSASFYKERLQDIFEQFQAIQEQENYIKMITENEIRRSNSQFRNTQNLNLLQFPENNENQTQLEDYLTQQQLIAIEKDIQKIREEQEAQLLIAMNKEKEIQEQLQQEELLKQKACEEARIAEENQQKRKQELIQIRLKIKENLPEEAKENTEGQMLFQFRFPDGAKFFWRISIFHKIEILFNFIMTLDYYLENYEEICHDQFDLMQTIPSISLVDKKQSNIQDIFQNSDQELLYVKFIN